jgi:hypothetical protein
MQVFIPLAVIVLPVILLFGALALPLRKDQPMEAYLAAMISFVLKPHLRLWEPDGIESLVEITVPKVEEVIRVKDISQNEAQKRLGYLAEIADSRGWVVRGTGAQTLNSSMIGDVYFEAQQTEDMLDNDTKTAHILSDKLEVSTAKHHQDMVAIAQGKPAPVQQQPVVVEPQSNIIQPAAAANYFATHTPVDDAPPPQISSFHEAYEPKRETKHEPKPIEKPASDKPARADIINLASNGDLSIATIAREAKRIHAKADLNEEVIVKLR